MMLCFRPALGEEHPQREPPNPPHVLLAPRLSSARLALTMRMEFAYRKGVHYCVEQPSSSILWCYRPLQEMCLST